MGSRRKARECALQMLFAADVAEMPAADVVRSYWAELGEPDLDQTAREFASRHKRFQTSSYSTSAYARAPNTGVSHVWRWSIATSSVSQFTSFFTNQHHARSLLTKHWRSRGAFLPMRLPSSSMAFSTPLSAI